MTRIALLILCFSSAIVTGHAADPPHSGAIIADVSQLQSFDAADRTYLNSSAYLQVLHDKFIAAEPPERRGSCDTMDLVRRDLITLVNHLLINQKPEPSLRLERPTEFSTTKFANQQIIGAWSETWTLSMCGTMVRRGLVMLKTSSGDLVMIPEVPGTTFTDLRLQIDTLKIGLPAFNIPKCDQTHFTIMDVQIVDAAQIAQHDWREKWTIQMCGQLRSRIVHYGPGGPGGAPTFRSAQVQGDVEPRCGEVARVTRQSHELHAIANRLTIERVRVPQQMP